MFCPVPEEFNEHRKCVSIWQIDNGFLTGQSLRLLKSGYTVRAKQGFGAASQTNLTGGLISFVAQAMYCGLASIPGSGDAISLISNVTFANQLRYPGSGSPTDSTELPEVFFEFPSNPIGKSVIVKAFLTGQSWQVNTARAQQAFGAISQTTWPLV